MMSLPYFGLEIVFLTWIISALLRTLSYLRIKRQDYKLQVMKRFALVFTIGASVYVIIRISKVFVEIFDQDADAWQNEH